MGKKIHAVFSYAGNRNFGDDYILSEWIKFSTQNNFARKFLVSTDSTWLQSHHFDDDAVFNTIFPATTYPFVKEWKDNNPEEKMSTSQYIIAGWKAADQFVEQLEWRRVLNNIASFHVCGGGYLNKIFPQAHAVAALMQRLALRLNVPIYGTGLGLLPTEENNAELAELLAGFAFVEVRDRNSYEFLQSNYPAVQAILGSDDTFLTPVRSAIQPVRKPSIFVNLQSDLGAHPQEGILKRIVELKNHVGDGYDVQYIHFFQNSDSRFFERLKGALNVTQSYNKEQLYEGGLPFQKGDICISSRFHMHILASRAGARGAFISGKPGYYDIKHQSVVDVGSNWTDFMSNDFSPEKLIGNPEPAINEHQLRSEKTKLARIMLS